MNGKKRIFLILAFLILSFVLIIYGASRSQGKVTITFIDGYNDKIIDKQIIEPGEDAQVPEVPKHDSFVFGGWYKYGSVSTLVSDFKNIEKDLKVEARYKADRNKNGIADDVDTYYTVRFIDGVTSSLLKTESVLVGMGATAPVANTYENYTFTGWDKDYSNIQGNVDVTSVYTRENVVIMYTLNFYDKEKNIFTTQRIAAGNSSASVIVPEYVGYSFEGWYLDTNLTEKYELGTIVNSNLNIYGKWIKNKFKVEFNANGGTAIDSDKVPTETIIGADYGDKIKLPDAEKIYRVTYHGEEGATIPESHGVNAIFLGWCKGDTITCLPENLIAPNTELEIKENAVFVAYWGEAKNEISLGSASQNDTPGLTFTFKGWALTSDGEERYDAGESILLEENLELYAKWSSKVKQYSVSFNTDGGNAIEPLILDYDAEIDLSEFVPTKTGYTFKEWNLVGDGSIPERMPENGFEVIAIWEVNQYTIRFMDGETELTDLTITQDYNTDVNAPEALVKEGHTFTGWSPAVPEKMPAENLTIYATWMINEYTVSFYHKVLGLEWEIGNTIILYNNLIPTAQIPAVQLPVPYGHQVVWRTIDGTEWNLDTNVVKGNLKLYADLKLKTYTLQFNYEDGNTYTRTVNHGESINPPSNTVKTGYTCRWNRSSYILISGNDVITESCTKNTYRVTLKNIYGYFIGIEYQTSYEFTLEYEAIKNISNPTRKNYEFTGWTVAGEGSSIEGSIFKMGHTNATLTANWRKK